MGEKFMKKSLYALMVILCLGLAQAALAAQPPGITTAPYTVSYSAKLTTAAGTPVTTTQSVRFSIWSDADSDPTDYMPLGTINPAAVGYTGWEETHLVTPDANGLFHVRLGTINTLPNFTLSAHLQLEVDVKASLLPATSYEVLDPDTNALIDRFPIDSSAFTINADTVDNMDAGYLPGNMPYLDGTGLLPVGVIPGGTNSDSFILDFDDTVAASPPTIALQFGNTLGKILEYDLAAGWFNFNDDVNITGNLTVTGTINGVTVGPYNQTLAYEPEYNDTIYQGDGLNNNGKLEIFYVDADGVPGNSNYNYYMWTTKKAASQDIDLVIRTKLPEGFTGFQATPVEFTYRTADGVLANNQVDVSMEDTAGNPIVLAGASGLVSAAFTTANITFGGGETFTPGQPVTIKIKLTALNAGAAYASTLKLNYIGQ
jgi:hypothetical protein